MLSDPDESKMPAGSVSKLLSCRDLIVRSERERENEREKEIRQTADRSEYTQVSEPPFVLEDWYV